MPTPSHAQQLLERATAVLPASDEDLIYKGIAAGVSERIMALKKARARLQGKQGSLEELERRIQTEGVSPDDHTLYTYFLRFTHSLSLHLTPTRLYFVASKSSFLIHRSPNPSDIRRR